MNPHPASYRDTDGYVFGHEGNIYRYIHPAYEAHYSHLMNGGLYDELVKKRKLIPHHEILEIDKFDFTEGKVLLPGQIPFISYPYEWSFDMWKDAALLTLHIAAAALKKGMVLKDATPFNIQFLLGKPVFIDTLSFEIYEKGKPWIAYRQFSECFLAPLLLMHYCHPGCHKLFTVYPNGIPFDVLVSLLPRRSKWNMNTQLHIHLQAKFSRKPGGKVRNENNFSKQKHELLIKGLENFVLKTSAKKIKSEWNDYYTGTIPGDNYLVAKTELVHSFTREMECKNVIDLGANDGHFSLLFGAGTNVIATDTDSNCVNDLYLKLKKKKITNLLPLVADLVTPSPAIGWNNAERDSLNSRLQADLVLALALVHHLAITRNIPLTFIAGWLLTMADNLVIEFVPRSDEKVKQLMQNREDIFDDYNPANFRSIFAAKYQILREEKIGNTERILYLMKRK